MLTFRPICDALLDHELLSYKASLMWTKTFQLMRKIIGGVDYKVLDTVNCASTLKIRDSTILHQIEKIKNYEHHFFGYNLLL